MQAEILLHLSYKKVSFGVKRKYTASLYYSILSNYQFYKRIERKKEKTKKEKYWNLSVINKEILLHCKQNPPTIHLMLYI